MSDNGYMFYCSVEDLEKKLEEIKFPKALNYRMILAMPPKREQTKGIWLPDEAKDAEHFRDSVGRILRIGGTVGEVPALRDCKNLKVGDYVTYNYYAAGSIRKIKGLEVKVIVDDIVDLDITDDPNAMDKLYDL